jgi:hypothetical protein
VQRLLAGIRTDLDSFTEVEAFSLMTSGCRMAETEFAKLEGFGDLERVHRSWRFLRTEPVLRPGPGYDELTRHLTVASMVFGKVWKLARPLTVLAVALALALLFGLWRLWQANQQVVLVTVRGLGIFLALLIAILFVPTVVRLVRYQQSLRNLGLRAVLAAVLAAALKIHLLLFDPLFLQLGRVGRFVGMRRTRVEQDAGGPGGVVRIPDGPCVDGITEAAYPAPERGMPPKGGAPDRESSES